VLHDFILGNPCFVAQAKPTPHKCPRKNTAY